MALAHRFTFLGKYQDELAPSLHDLLVSVAIKYYIHESCFFSKKDMMPSRTMIAMARPISG